MEKFKKKIKKKLNFWNFPKMQLEEEIFHIMR